MSMAWEGPLLTHPLVLEHRNERHAAAFTAHDSCPLLSLSAGSGDLDGAYILKELPSILGLDGRRVGYIAKELVGSRRRLLLVQVRVLQSPGVLWLAALLAPALCWGCSLACAVCAFPNPLPLSEGHAWCLPCAV
jgi:hypothetical protein